MKILNIQATDIPDSWFQALYALEYLARSYVVQHGSFVGQTRREFDFAVIEIKNPYSEPYDSMLPQIPAHLGIPNPVAPGYVEQYLPYLMTNAKEDNEEYTYGSRINQLFRVNRAKINKKYSGEIKTQCQHWIDVLRETPNTNQAVIQVAQPSDCTLEDPPCLRSIHLKVIDNKLVAYPYFRSNDLWGGFPANLAGIAVLQKYIADNIGIEMGSMIYSCSGLHIYGYCDEVVRIRTGRI